MLIRAYLGLVSASQPMSRRPLDLTGILVPAKPSKPDKSDKPVKPKRTRVFKLTARRLLQYPYQLGGFFVCLFVFLLLTHLPHGRLRHIQHIPCKQKHGVYTCSPPKGVEGDLVVSMTDACKSHVFSVGGVPFTHARWNGMFRVRSAPSVQIMDAFPGCHPSAFVDSRTEPRERTSDLVWCAANDHRSFTVTVNEDEILRDAGGALFSPQHNGVWTCFTYENVPAKSEVQVLGDGHTNIFVYVHPDRVKE